MNSFSDELVVDFAQDLSLSKVQIVKVSQFQWDYF